MTVGQGSSHGLSARAGAVAAPGSRLARLRGNRSLRTVLAPVLAVALFATCGLVLVELGATSVGTPAIAVGAAAALLPVVPVVAALLWADRWEPEPPRLLLAAFAWGACVAALVALGVNETAVTIARGLLGSGEGTTVGAVVSAPFAEEAVKGLFVLGVWRMLRREFDGVIDGVVYAGITAAGFAFTENIYYFGAAFADGGLGNAGSGVVAAFLLRGVTTPFVHPLFGMIFGIGVGLAATRSARWVRVCAPLSGYLLAVAAHALWNLVTISIPAAQFRAFYLLIVVPILFGACLFVAWQRGLEQRVVSNRLPEMVHAGWVAPSEVRLLASLSGRRRWRARVRKHSGKAAAASVFRYQAAVSELAFLAERIACGTAARDAELRRADLVEALVASRADAVARAG